MDTPTDLPVLPTLTNDERSEELLPGRVLLVEDDEVQMHMMSEAIRGLGDGWKVVGVSTAEECLKTLETTTFSAVVIDLVLPDGSGMDILREIRNRGWVLATVLVTAHGSERTAVEALRLGVSDYVKKDEGYLAYLAQVVARTVTDYRQRLRKQSAYSRLRVELSRRTSHSLLDSFAAPIVHDIKSPLTYIIGWSELLGIGRGAAREPEKISRLILKGARTIEQLVNRLLKFARQESEERVDLDLTGFLSQLVKTEVDHLTLQNVRLAADLCPSPVTVTASLGALEQIFRNLIANAAECMVIASGGGQIELSLRREERHAVATVTDNGPGIPADVFPKMFQVGSTFGKGERGTGLGLAIVAGLVWEHGGRIEAENVPERGARFTVRLPLRGCGPVALVLEDESYVQQLMTSQLEALGVRAEVYPDGTGVLENLETGRWDLVILDLRTPNVSGIEVFEKILEKRPDLTGRTMFVSGGIKDRAVQDLLLAHPVPCLPKPYTIEEFNDFVLFILRASGKR